MEEGLAKAGLLASSRFRMSSMQASSSSSTLLIRGGCLQSAPQRSAFVLCSGTHEAPAACASVTSPCAAPQSADAGLTTA